jgi:hypothetical protein
MGQNWKIIRYKIRFAFLLRYAHKDLASKEMEIASLIIQVKNILN